jgi:hypothetical protein
MASNGGGVIPYSIYNNKIYLLLGREDCYDKSWDEDGKYSDFGGSKEPHETNLSAVAREAYEESNGLLGPYESLLAILQDESQSLKIHHYKSEFYFINVPYIFFIDKIFHNMIKCQHVVLETLGKYGKIKFDDEVKKGEVDKYMMRKGFFEKDRIKYFPLDMVLSEIYDTEKKKKYRENFIKLMKRFNKTRDEHFKTMSQIKIWKFFFDDDKLLHPNMADLVSSHVEGQV